MERTLIVAATLAGLAEAALWALPVRGVALEATGAGAGPMVSWVAFVVWFTGAVLVASLLRHSKALPAVGAAVGIGAGAWQAFAGSPDVVGVVVVEVVGIAALLRAVMLATRDWREPATSLAWGSALLLVEVAMAQRAGWVSALPGVVPTFFLASLASRGLTTWAEPGGPGASRPAAPGPRRWTASVALGVGIAAAGMTAAVALGTSGGVLQGMGRVVIPLGLLVLVVGGFALTEKGIPAALVDRGGRWLVSLPFIAVGALIAWLISHRQHRRTVFGIFTGIPLNQHAHSTSTVERIFGLLLFASIAYLLLRAFRARWAEPEGGRRRRATDRVQVAPAGGPGRRRRARRRSGRDLPEDLVRRWYAQTLELLEEKNVPRAAASTPAEFADQVAQDLPGTPTGMVTLTRAYERVRYGSARLGPSELDALDEERGVLLRDIAAREALERDDEVPPGR